MFVFSKWALVLASAIFLAGCSSQAPNPAPSVERIHIDPYRVALTNDSWESRVRDDVYLAKVVDVAEESYFEVPTALQGGKTGVSYYTPVKVSLEGNGELTGRTVNLALLSDDGSNFNIDVLTPDRLLVVFSVGGLVTRSDGIEVLTPSFIGFESEGRMVSLSAEDKVSVDWLDAIKQFGFK